MPFVVSKRGVAKDTSSTDNRSPLWSLPKVNILATQIAHQTVLRVLILGTTTPHARQR